MSTEEPNQNDRRAKVIVCLLLPFFICLTTYYAVGQLPPDNVNANNRGGLVLTKILIIVLLSIYVLTSCYAFQIEKKFCILIAVGLVISSLADGLSLFRNEVHNLLSYELLLLGLSRSLYICAFGCAPLKLFVGFLTALPFVGLLMVLTPHIASPLVYCVSAYLALDALMEWRVIVRLSQQKGPLSPSIIVTSIGGASLVVSDAVLLYNMFRSHIMFADVVIPLTYYTGQLSIASSIFHLPHKLRPPNQYLHISGDELCEQCCKGCPFP